MTGSSGRLWAWVATAVCLAAAIVLGAVAVVADLDTAGQIAGIAGAVLALAGLAVALRALRPRPPDAATGPAITAGRDLGTGIIGSRNRVGNSPAPPPTSPPSTPAPAPSPSPAPSPPPAPAPPTGGPGISAGRDIGTGIIGDDNSVGS
ncbi:hypothetical protein OG216_31465 [Streptomycetaceae bacterium NBC_01309]